MKIEIELSEADIARIAMIHNFMGGVTDSPGILIKTGLHMAEYYIKNREKFLAQYREDHE